MGFALWKCSISTVKKDPVHSSCRFSTNVAAFPYPDSSLMWPSRNTWTAMPVRRNHRVALGLSIPITWERAAPCTPCFPFVFPPQFHGLRKFCTQVMSAWLPWWVLRLWVPTRRGRVVQPPYARDEAPQHSLLYKWEHTQKKKGSKIPDAQLAISAWKVSQLLFLLLTHCPQHFKASCVFVALL